MESVGPNSFFLLYVFITIVIHKWYVVAVFFEIFILMQVILATNIAESSVTIPKVAHVIDSCRSLQVFWDFNRKSDSSELVWVSKSQVLSGSSWLISNTLR